MNKFFKKKTFLIAEAGNNHEGSLFYARKLIDAASKTGADAIKFQTFITENFITKKEKKRFKMLKRFELSHEQFYSLWNYSRKKKIIFFSTPFDTKSALFLNKFVKMFKIASSDNNNLSLIDQILKFKKKTIISTGMLTNKEIRSLYNFAILKSNKKNLSFAHCISNYPAKYSDVNIRQISYLKKKYPIDVGFSDHSIGISAPLASVNLGASFVEKHFTLDNNFSNFRDHKLALNPKDFKRMVIEIRNTEKINSFVSNTRNDLRNKPSLRRSLYATKDIKIGDYIDKSNTELLRPNTKNKGLHFIKFIKKKSKKSYKKGVEIKI
jgi:N,N'-diacetyllegionaminate synthase